jgi:hypothetical protein
MAITLRGAGSYALNNSSINIPFTTVANDMIVLVAGSANANWANGSSTLPNNTTVTWSGLGATWTSFAYNNGASYNGYAVWIGTGCTAGLSTITRSGTPASTAGLYVLAQFSGVASIASYSPILSSTTNGATVSTTVSYNQGQLLLATAECFTWSTTSGNWNGVADTLAFASSGTRNALIDYLIAPSTQSGVTYTSPRSNGGQIFNSGQAFVINPAVSSNFLSFT